MPRLHHHRATDQHPADATPDWAWTDDADMPSDREINRHARDILDFGRRISDHPVDSEHPLPLSPQQHDVLVCLSLGLTGPQIAERLSLTLAAVVDSRKQARRKLGANHEAHAVAIAIRRRLIE